ncbi:MAG: DMT family transporter [Pseudomonadota bacterium]
MAELSRRTGVILLLVSALVFSTAGIFTKGVEAGAWEVIFWRGFFACLFTFGYVVCRGKLREEFVQMGKWGWLVAIVSAAGTAAFIPSFKLTTVANVVLIYASAPMLAAFLAWFWFGERMRKAAIVGCIAAFIGVVLIVGGSLKSINLTGDLLAFWMTLCMTVVIVIYRRAPKTPAAGPAVLASVILLFPALIFGNPFAIETAEIMILAAFGLIFAIASVTLSEGARRVPSGETALISTLESPFAIALAWVLFAEVPVIATFLGGALILAGVIGSQATPAKKQAFETISS